MKAKTKKTKSRADIERILNKIVEILVREYKPETIVLYGSYAYGNPTRHSDIDLLIVKETEKNRIDRYVEAAGLIFDPNRRIPVQPLVLTPSELQMRMDVGDHFIRDVLTKGVRLYDRIRKTAETAV